MLLTVYVQMLYMWTHWEYILLYACVSTLLGDLAPATTPNDDDNDDDEKRRQNF